MVTPFDAQDELDLDAARVLARWLTQDGWNDGLVVNGTTGESATTSDREKASLIEAVVEAVAGRAKVLAGVGTSDTRHSIALAQSAESAGADGLLVVTPYYSLPSQIGVLQHFRAIADSTSLPVMLYDIPKRCGIAIAAPTLVAASEHERIVAVKDAKGDLESSSWVMRNTDLAYYSGDDALNLPLLAIGATGFVSVVGHVAGNMLRNMQVAYHKGDVRGALDMHRQLLPAVRGMFRAPAAASVKAALAVLGLPGGPVRSPLVGTTTEERAALIEDLKESGTYAEHALEGGMTHETG